MSNEWRFTNTMTQGRQYTLPLRNHPSELIDFHSSKKRKLQKQPDFKHLQDQIARHQMEIHILKVHQKEIFQNFIECGNPKGQTKI